MSWLNRQNIITINGGVGGTLSSHAARISEDPGKAQCGNAIDEHYYRGEQGIN